MLLPLVAALLATASASTLIPRKTCPSPFIIRAEGGFDPPQYWYLANPAGKESNIYVGLTTDNAPVFHLGPQGQLQFHGSPSRPEETFVAKVIQYTDEKPHTAFWTLEPASGPEGTPACSFVPQADGPCTLQCTVTEIYGTYTAQYECPYAAGNVTFAEMALDGNQKIPNGSDVPCRKYTLVVEHPPSASA